MYLYAEIENSLSLTSYIVTQGRHLGDTSEAKARLFKWGFKICTIRGPRVRSLYDEFNLWTRAYASEQPMG